MLCPSLNLVDLVRTPLDDIEHAKRGGLVRAHVLKSREDWPVLDLCCTIVRDRYLRNPPAGALPKIIEATGKTVPFPEKEEAPPTRV